MDIKITKDTATSWEINGKYLISKDDGYIECVFEEEGGRIPQEVYDKRDQLMFNCK